MIEFKTKKPDIKVLLSGKVEISFKGEQNLIIGYDFENEKAHIVPLLLLDRIVQTDISHELGKEEIDFAYECFKEYENELVEKE